MIHVSQVTMFAHTTCMFFSRCARHKPLYNYSVPSMSMLLHLCAALLLLTIALEDSLCEQEMFITEIAMIWQSILLQIVTCCIVLPKF